MRVDALAQAVGAAASALHPSHFKARRQQAIRTRRRSSACHHDAAVMATLVNFFNFLTQNTTELMFISPHSPPYLP
jgi:hypothetical protein